MFKPLLRTMPSMCGNVKIACQLSDYIVSDEKEYENDTCDTYDCYVRGAFLRPLSHTIYDKQLKASLLGGSYDYDLKTFYTYYNDIMYNNVFDVSKTDMQELDLTNPVYDRNKDFEMGAYRIKSSNSENNMEVYAPIYVESYSDIPNCLYIELTFKTFKKDIKKKLRVNIIRNKDSKYNYLEKYLNKYSNILDSNCINVSYSNKQAIYNGIDLLHGGKCEATDNEIGNLFKQQNTINNFDAIICSGYKRNRIVMKQVLPLAFSFSFDNILSDKEKPYTENCKVEVSFRYYNQYEAKSPFYDWECDYDEYSEKILSMSNTTGTLQYSNGQVDNIMNVGYPSLNETNMIDYVFSNKLTKNYSRWILSVSKNEDIPYVVNLSSAFSKNQNSNYLYHTFPSVSHSIVGLCKVITENNKAYQDYNLVFPFGDTKSDYLDNTSTEYIPEKYKNIINSFAYNWFDIIYTDNTKNNWINETSWIDSVSWVDCDDEEVMYKGIMYDIQTLYINSYTTLPKLDKFGVFLIPNINILQSSNVKNIKSAMYTLEQNNGSNQNCDLYSDILTKDAYLNKVYHDNTNLTLFRADASSVDFQKTDALLSSQMYLKSVDETDKAEVSSWQSYTFGNDAVYLSTYAYSSKARYVDLADLGISAEDLDDWYDANDFMTYHSSILDNVISKSGLMSYINKDAKLSTYFAELKDEDLGGLNELVKNANNILGTTHTLFKTYKSGVGEFHDNQFTYDSNVINSYEMLPLHSIYPISERVYHEDTKSYTYSNIRLDDSLCYVSNTYGMEVTKIYQGTNKEIKYIYTDGGPYFDAGNNTYYTIIASGFMTEPISKDLLKSYDKGGLDDIEGDLEDSNGWYNYEKSTYILSSEIYRSPICDDLYISSKVNTEILPAVKINRVNKDEAYAYISINDYQLANANSEEIKGTSYYYTLYRKASFINSNLLDEVKYMDWNTLVANAVTTLEKQNKDNGYHIEDINDLNTSAGRLNKLVEICTYQYIHTLESMITDRYMFMPAVFAKKTEYANNIFVKKDKQMKTSGSQIQYNKIDEDINVIWVDAYNLKQVMNKFTPDIDAEKKILDGLQTFKARFLNKTHVYLWYTELSKDYNYESIPNLASTWGTMIYVKTKSFATIAGKLSVVDKYTPIETYARMNKWDHLMVSNEENKDVFSFKEFYDKLFASDNNLLYRIQLSEEGEEVKYSNWFELVFDLKCIRLDQDIFEDIVRLDQSKEIYRDLYLYSFESENEWEYNYIGQPIEVSKYESSLNSSFIEPLGHLLVPLFDNIYVQEKEDTVVYAKYLLNNIETLKVVKDNEVIDKYYTNGLPSISWMYKLTESEVNYWISDSGTSPKRIGTYTFDGKDYPLYQIQNRFKESFGKELYEVLYSKYGSTLAQLSATKIDELGYGVENLNTKTIDGVNYGFFLIDYDIDNSGLNLNLTTTSTLDSYIKFIKYVDGVDILNNEEYFKLNIKKIMPFCNSQPTDALYKIPNLIKQTSIEFKHRYSQSKPNDYNENSNIQEINTKVITSDYGQTNIMLNRYFGKMIPYIKESEYIKNLWRLKYKSINKTMLNNGNYKSIGDCAIYSNPQSIEAKTKLNVFNDYTNIIDTKYCIEDKSFNHSQVVNLEKTLTYEPTTLYKYEALLGVQTDDYIFGIFKKLIKNSNTSKFTDDEILFLYNQYKCSISSVATKLSLSKEYKLYKVKYVFSLR